MRKVIPQYMIYLFVSVTQVLDLLSLYQRFMFISVKSKPFENSFGSLNSCSNLNGYLICIDSQDPYFRPYQTSRMTDFCKNSH